jgi:hypothetical protein
MLNLDGCRGHMLLLCRCPFLSRRLGSRSSGATVVAHIVHGGVIHDRLVVNIGDVRRADVVDGLVVIQLSVIPVSTLIANTRVAVAVCDAAVETYLGTPVSGVPNVDAVVPAPIAGCPQQTSGGNFNPCARHPEVAVRTVSPISGRPDIACAGAGGLLIHRQRRRCDRDGHCDLGQRRGPYGQYYEREY